MPSFDSPVASRNHVPVVPNDSTVLPLFRAIWVGGAGVVVVAGPNGVDGSFTCVAGSLLPVAGTRVRATGTTATLLVALY